MRVDIYLCLPKLEIGDIICFNLGEGRIVIYEKNRRKILLEITLKNIKFSKKDAFNIAQVFSGKFGIEECDNILSCYNLCYRVVPTIESPSKRALFCAETQARTGDLFLFREALYQLSYLGI